MKLYYVANARMPTEKAHGIQIAKMCEAFILCGIEVTLIVPKRSIFEDVRNAYHLSVPVHMIQLPVVNLYTRGRIGFLISSLSFMISSVLFLWSRRIIGKRFSIYTVDMDTYSYTAVRLVGVPYYIEMHGIKRSTVMNRFFFMHVSGVICINKEISSKLQKVFYLKDTVVIVEPNGVDLSLFSDILTKKEVRKILNVSQHTHTALYVGRIYPWKGLEIIATASTHLNNIHWYIVGGTKEEYERVTGKKVTSLMHFIADVPHYRVPMWLAMADVLLVLGTKQNEESYRFTSPMKVFEYMASGRPVVASATPALTSVLPKESVFFYKPDSIEDFARVVTSAINNSVQTQVSTARLWVEGHTWCARAERIGAFICETDIL